MAEGIVFDADAVSKDIAEGIAAIQQASTMEELKAIKAKYAGANSAMTRASKAIGSLAKNEKKEAGKVMGKLRADFGRAYGTKEASVKAAQEAAELAAETVDMTLPIRRKPLGARHPLPKLMEDVEDFFVGMGWQISDGPEVETEWFDFDALNFGPDHPARQMQDTFYIPNPDSADFDDSYVVRTHTSPVQIRTMENKKPPIRIIAPGRTYRSDYDATHTPMFHQVEGLVIDKTTTMAHLKGCLYDFVRAFFEIDDIRVRYRPSYFPFTEPSAEMDIGCKKSKDELKIGEGDDWLEILGCGMVHPKVLAAGGIDPDEYQGFAFGVGIDRLAMLKYGIPDLRTFFESDLRWLKHYGFVPLDESSMTGGLSNNGGLAR